MSEPGTPLKYNLEDLKGYIIGRIFLFPHGHSELEWCASWPRRLTKLESTNVGLSRPGINVGVGYAWEQTRSTCDFTIVLFPARAHLFMAWFAWSG